MKERALYKVLVTISETVIMEIKVFLCRHYFRVAADLILAIAGGNTTITERGSCDHS